MLSDKKVHATIPVSDLARARAWYEEKLGVRPVQDLPGGLMYVVGDGSRFLLFPTPFAGTAKNTAAGFQVDDIEAEVADLKGRGVVFEEYDFPQLKTVDGIATLEANKAAWFKDSEGNTLGIVEFT